METPLVIQLRDNWIENEDFRSKAPMFLKSISFIENSDFGYLYPIKIVDETKNFAEEIASNLIDVLRKIVIQ
ncbi:MAG: hypothetical protein MH321_06050 [Leptospiraceae bacterium]|nr:hypothetical protein [Leptospiraceae bacterium]